MKFILFGPNVPLSDIAQEIMAEDLDALSRRVASGWDVNKQVKLADLTWELPIALALVENKRRVLDFLLDHGANLNVKGEPAIVWAVRNCDPAVIEMLVRRGAALDQFDRVRKSAYSAALYSERYDLLPILLRLGLPVDVDQGVSLRQAAYSRQSEAVRFFIENGLNPNLRAPDMVFPYNPTAVAVAAQNGDFAMVKYLVEHGADITLKDDYGHRPYSLAAEGGHAELANYLKGLEDPALHDVENRTLLLRTYHVPPELLEFLRSDTRRIELGNERPRYVEFHDVLGVKEMRWYRSRILDLLQTVDDYSETGFLVWSPKHRKLAHADYDHDVFRVLCSWKQFVQDPRRWIDSIFA